LIEKLQSKLALIENITIDITAFKSQVYEINEKLEAVQHYLYKKVDTIQKFYQEINNSMKSIYAKEKDALVSRSKFEVGASSGSMRGRTTRCLGIILEYQTLGVTANLLELIGKIEEDQTLGR
jgi:hypothetical protein